MSDVKEFVNRAIDLDEVMPNAIILFKGTALGKEALPAVWISCKDVHVRYPDKEPVKVRDLIDCAFFNIEERDEFYNYCLNKWKHIQGIEEAIPLEMTNNEILGKSLDIKLH
jgi:hypothetical protein